MIEGPLRATKGSGRGLPQKIRQQWQPKLGKDLSAVRIHDDAKAADFATIFRAKAFTLGNDIYLGAEARSGTSKQRKALLAHELGHLYQGGSPQAIHRKVTVSGNASFFPAMTAALSRITSMNVIVKNGELTATSPGYRPKTFGHEIIKILASPGKVQDVNLQDMSGPPTTQNRTLAIDAMAAAGSVILDGNLFSGPDDLFIAQIFLHEITEQLSVKARTAAENKALEKAGQPGNLTPLMVQSYPIDHQAAFRVDLASAKVSMGVEFDLGSSTEVNFQGRGVDSRGCLHIQRYYVDGENRVIMFHYITNVQGEIDTLRISYSKKFGSHNNTVNGLRNFATFDNGLPDPSFRNVTR